MLQVNKDGATNCLKFAKQSLSLDRPKSAAKWLEHAVTWLQRDESAPEPHRLDAGIPEPSSGEA